MARKPAKPARKHDHARMTFREVEEAARRKAAVLIPLGSTEQHGPQCPMGDYRLAQALALALAERTDSIVAPPICFSEGASARNFSGALPIRPETLYALVWDICEGYLRAGFDHILLVCGDNGNVPILVRLARDFYDAKGIRIAMIEQYRWFTPEWLRELYGRDGPPIGHGGDPISSLNMHLFPDDMRPDLADKAVKRPFQGLTPLNYSQVQFGDRMFYIPMDYEELSPNGVRGDFAIASADVGARIWEGFLRIGTDIVEKFKTLDTGRPGAGRKTARKTAAR